MPIVGYGLLGSGVKVAANRAIAVGSAAVLATVEARPAIKPCRSKCWLGSLQVRPKLSAAVNQATLRQTG
jgi:hypothetical protein